MVQFSIQDVDLSALKGFLFQTFCYNKLKGGDVSSLSHEDFETVVFEAIPKFVEALASGEAQ